MADVPVARSPIAPAPPETVVAGWLVSARRSDAELTLSDCTPLAKLVVRGSAPIACAGVPLGKAARQVWEDCTGAEVLVVGRGPGEWLVLAPPATLPPIAARLGRAAEPVTVVDLTHGLALIRITGVRSADLLAKDCAIDLSGRGCPAGAVRRTAIAGLACDVIRDDRAGVPSYLVGCDRSAGQYLFDALAEDGSEFGLDIDGFREAG